ncbi:HK97 family phage prohead protease [Actinopolyspora halophila]|uniref:HK97 family phage prohead protease n=1 Tax=Actinopolyspora halophila TaxID=1850 RepID=UPI0003A8BB98|nr:HK97 family phage prohead protease [Actinopolyspora halophila]
MDTKHLAQVEIKDAERGEVEAVFSTFGVRDLDGDVTLKEAFTHGEAVKISSFGHGSWEAGQLPVGKGYIAVENNRAVLKGNFFLNTDAGRDTFAVMKELGDLGEWSFGFTVTDWDLGEFEGKQTRFIKKLNVYEVSPVLKGAGVGTGTLSVKSQGASFVGQCEQVLTELKALNARGAEILVKRSEQGKSLGAESSRLLTAIDAEVGTLKELLTESADNSESTPQPEEDTVLQHEWLRWVASQHGLAV